jgi:hypothetical protein
VVFRTFGSDIQDVIEEMNMFAEGRHPSYPGVYMDGRDGITDLRMSPETSGAFIRCAFHLIHTEMRRTQFFFEILDIAAASLISSEQTECMNLSDFCAETYRWDKSHKTTLPPLGGA